MILGADPCRPQARTSDMSRGRSLMPTAACDSPYLAPMSFEIPVFWSENSANPVPAQRRPAIAVLVRALGATGPIRPQIDRWAIGLLDTGATLLGIRKDLALAVGAQNMGACEVTSMHGTVSSTHWRAQLEFPEVGFVLKATMAEFDREDFDLVLGMEFIRMFDFRLSGNDGPPPPLVCREKFPVRR